MSRFFFIPLPSSLRMNGYFLKQNGLKKWGVCSEKSFLLVLSINKYMEQQNEEQCT